MIQEEPTTLTHIPLDSFLTCYFLSLYVGEQQNQIADLKGHDGPVWQVSWAHPKFGNLLASSSYDGTVIIWKETQSNVW